MSDLTPKTGPTFVEVAGRWLALLGVFIAAGQAGSAWITGHWRAETEQRKADQEIKMARIQSEGTLARQFLELILAKETNVADRALLLDALARLSGHPLQEWAALRRDVDRDHMKQVFAAYERQIEATRIRNATQREAATIMGRLEELNANLEREKDNEERRGNIQRERITLVAQLATLQGHLGTETTRVTETLAVITQSERGLTPSAVAGPAEATITFSQTITSEIMRRIAPADAISRMDAHFPFLQAALQEFQITDRAFVAAIVATLIQETEWFRWLEEEDTFADSARYEGRADLGNTQPGDGRRFKGRGYLMITGRANYARSSERLGLGQGLIVSPEDAARPEVAARIAVSYFADRRDRFVAALSSDDLTAFRRLVIGGTHGLDGFRELYGKILAELPIRRSDYRVLVQFAGQILRPDVRSMMLALREERWNVQGAEDGGERRANSANEVRYSREQDRRAAEDLAARVQASNVSGRPITAARNSAVAPSTLEVWISR
ncbi:MAG: hypothetical protein INF98_18205 [Roseomonas sp.]|nr:hypothetical protein [Roseomonas sp.]